MRKRSGDHPLVAPGCCPIITALSSVPCSSDLQAPFSHILYQSINSIILINWQQERMFLAGRFEPGLNLPLQPEPWTGPEPLTELRTKVQNWTFDTATHSLVSMFDISLLGSSSPSILLSRVIQAHCFTRLLRTPKNCYRKAAVEKADTLFLYVAWECCSNSVSDGCELPKTSLPKHGNSTTGNWLADVL